MDEDCFRLRPPSPIRHMADSLRLRTLVYGHVAVAETKASGRSRNIHFPFYFVEFEAPVQEIKAKAEPSLSSNAAGKNFHFLFYLDEFEAPVQEIKAKAEPSSSSIAVSENLWGSNKAPKLPKDLDRHMTDWLAGVND